MADVYIVGTGQTPVTRGQQRSVGQMAGDAITCAIEEEVFGKWMAQQAAASAPKADLVAAKIEEALAGFAGDRKLNLGIYGYTIRRARGKGATGFVATKNPKP